MNPLEFVRGQAPFDSLPPEAWPVVERGLEIIFFPKGEKVLQQGGAPGAHLYLIRKGEARLVQAGQTVGHLEAGELFGYPSLLSQQAPRFDVMVDEDLLVYRWPEASFRRLLEYPAFAQFFTHGLAERLRLWGGGEAGAGYGLELSLPVGELVGRPPVWLPRSATVGEAARLMQQHQISSVLVEGEPAGILTDRDLRNRVLAAGRGAEVPVAEVMSAPLKTLNASAPLFEALAYMVAQRIHHLPLEQGGRIVGVVTDTAFLHQQSRSPLQVVRRLERTRSLADLAGYAAELSGTVELLMAGGLGAAEVGRSVSSLNDQLVRMLCGLAEEQLGRPPTAYAWMVLGSEGRMEQTLLTDQDNALAFLSDTPQARSYFARLAEFVVNGLIVAGFPPCPGGYMATRWCKPLAEWEALFDHWVGQPKGQELLEAQIFFDFRVAYGELSLEPLQAVAGRSAKNTIFLAQLARAALQFRPPLGFFRQIREEAGGVDLKKGGIAPVVGLARVLALEAGSAAKSSFERLKAAEAGGSLSLESCETLCEALAFLMRLRLRHQLAQLKAGQTPSNMVPLDKLSALERRHLKEAFLSIHAMQDSLSRRFHTDSLG